MKSIAEANQRLQTAVRVTSDLYCLKARQSLDMAGYAPMLLETAQKKMIFRLAWFDLCEWASVGFDLSHREDLLSIWRNTSVHRRLGYNLTLARKNASESGFTSAEMTFQPEGLNYYPTGREDLEKLTNTELQEIAKDDGEYVWKPEGFEDFYKNEVIRIVVMTEEQDRLFRSSPLGQIVMRDETLREPE